jgi:hypothetical protein
MDKLIYQDTIFCYDTNDLMKKIGNVFCSTCNYNHLSSIPKTAEILFDMAMKKYGIK